MLDHLTILVSDYDRSKAFYLAALAPIGCEEVMELTREEHAALPADRVTGLGVDGTPTLWLRPTTGTISPTHVAFAASNKAAVDEFHVAALQAGGKDGGAPGLRPHYHDGYYAAFVTDPDGYNIEVVCHLGQ